MIDIARRVVPLCAATCADWRGTHARARRRDAARFLEARCASRASTAHVGLGPGACCGAITPEEYAENVRRIERFLAGNHREFVDELTAEMQEAAEELDFERAGRLKARIDTINSLADKQHAVSSRDLSADVVGFFREETVAGVNVLVIREGRIVNANEFVLNRGTDVPDQDLLRNVPHALLRHHHLHPARGDRARTARGRRGHGGMAHGQARLGPTAPRCASRAPQKGEKADLLTMAETNAQHTLSCATRCARTTTTSASTTPFCSWRAPWPWTRRPCASSASTSPPSTAPTRWPPWWCSPAESRTRTSTAASR